MILAYTKSLPFLLRKFINHFMIDGKKDRAEKLFFLSLSHLKKKENANPTLIFLKALKNSMPFIEVRSVRRGGASYQIPVPLKENRSLSLSMKWIVQAAKKREGSFAFNLCSVLAEASQNQGESVKKREALHSLALKNRSLTHYRWF